MTPARKTRSPRRRRAASGPGHHTRTETTSPETSLAIGQLGSGTQFPAGSLDPTAGPNPLDALRHAAAASSALIDEHYTVTVVVLEREIDQMPQTLVVELIDTAATPADQRWQAVAYDELRDLRTPTVTGPTIEAVISQLPWSRLHPHCAESGPQQSERRD